MNLEDNPLNLTPITENKLFLDPDNSDRAYVYASDKSIMLHLRGKNITKELPIGSLIEIVYMEPNHLFLMSVNSKENKQDYIYTISKGSKEENDKYHTSIKFNRLGKDLKFKPQDPKQSNAKHSGVESKIIPYKCYNAVGWLFNIEKFQPEK